MCVQSLQKNLFSRRNKTALGPRGQTSLKIEDLRQTKNLNKFKLVGNTPKH